MLWPRRSTACSRQRSFTVVGHGAASTPWNTPHSNGSTGSTTAACWNPSETSRQQRPRQTSTQPWKHQTWPRSLDKSASGKPGVVQIRPMLGFKSLRKATATLDGIETAHMIRKGQLGSGCPSRPKQSCGVTRNRGSFLLGQTELCDRTMKAPNFLSQSQFRLRRMAWFHPAKWSD